MEIGKASVDEPPTMAIFSWVDMLRIWIEVEQYFVDEVDRIPNTMQLTDYD